MAIIRIAFFEIFHGQAVKGSDDNLRLEIERGEVFAQRSSKRADIGGIVEIGRYDPDRSLPAHGFERIEGLIACGCGGRRRILRIERKQEYAVAARTLERFEAGLDAGIAVAH